MQKYVVRCSSTFSPAQGIQGPAISVACANHWLNALDAHFFMRVNVLCMRKMMTLNNHFPIARYKYIECLLRRHD